jgi:HEPN domain-containing protein
MVLSRTELRRLSEEKARDARFLLDRRSFSNAFYLAGYAVEIGLKAAIASQFRANTIPEKRFVIDIYSHDLRKLIEVAGLTQQLAVARQSNGFDANWATIENWRPESRYVMVGRASARAMVGAVDDPQDGVLHWIRSHW